MTIPQRVWRVVAIRHVHKHEDYLVQGCLRLLREDNAKLREEFNGLRPVGFSPSGRYVFGRVVAGLLLGCMLLSGAVSWKYSSSAAAFRKGFERGMGATRSGM
jgi:hypothetical protein